MSDPKLLNPEELAHVLSHVADALGHGVAAELGGHIAAMEARNAARLTPSGQVTEDELEEQAREVFDAALARREHAPAAAMEAVRFVISSLATKAARLHGLGEMHHAKALRLEEARDAAVEDNAALLERGRRLLADDSDEAWTAFANCVTSPHPGATFLAEHAKALKAAQQTLELQQAECHTLRRAFLHERHRAETTGAPPEHVYNARWAESLLADERKALARARNEGLEKAAGRAKRVAEHGCNPYAACTCDWGSRLDGLEDDIRAMKESEE